MLATTTTPATHGAEYRALVRSLRDAGLLRRRPWYYALKVAGTLAGFVASAALFVLVGDSAATLVVAAISAATFTQVVFLGHDAGHLQIFRSRRTSRLFGLLVGNLLTGLCFGWWVPKHNAHHAHPNQAGRDPDIAAGVVAFTDEIAGGRRGLGALLARHQAWLFAPLLLLEGLAMHANGVKALLQRRDRAACLEGVLLAAHTAAYLGLVFWVLPPLTALAFVAVHQAAFGLYLGCSFAPNHKGMPILEEDSAIGFAERQVMTSRNLAGGRIATFALGGLNYQIEHHLFPTMPRPNLRRAQPIVRAFCADQGLPYREDHLVASYGQVFAYLRKVGAHAPIR